LKILVTGSAGFIGYHVSARLLAEGHRVTGVDNLVPYYDVRLKERRHATLGESAAFQAHRLDLSDMAGTLAVLEQEEPDVIVHLAAQAGVRYSLENPSAYMTSNILGTFNLLEACRRRRVQHFVMASTSSAYGASTSMPVRETDNAATPLTIYAASKLAGEDLCHSYAHIWHQPITTFRFFSVYGPWGRPDMALFKFTDAALKGEPIELYNAGRMERDFTYVDDLVEAIIRLIPQVPELGKPVAACDSLSPVAPYRLVNIGGGNPVELLDFIAEIERCVGRPIARDNLPMQPGDVVKTWANTELLQALTGFCPDTPVSVGVERFVAWFRAYYGR
jgi:UDP-glucuronate 4-epimerase